MPFADTQTRFGAANGRIILIVDRTGFYRPQLAIRRVRASCALNTADCATLDADARCAPWPYEIVSPLGAGGGRLDADRDQEMRTTISFEGALDPHPLRARTRAKYTRGSAIVLTVVTLPSGATRMSEPPDEEPTSMT